MDANNAQKQHPVVTKDWNCEENKILLSKAKSYSIGIFIKDGSIAPPVTQIEKNGEQPCKLYKKRWIILLLYIFYCMSSLMHFIAYSSIADVLVDYYQISYTAVDWSSMIYLLLYVPCSFPGSYILNKFGLRTSILIGITGTCLGGLVKIASVEPDRYWVLMLGQGLVAVFQVLILPVSPKLAATWFGDNEVFLASSIGLSAIQLGSAVGFLIPPLVVTQGSKEEIEYGLHLISYIYATIPILLLPCLYLYFDDIPPKPPSLAQFRMQNNKQKSVGFTKSIAKMLKNWSYVLLLIHYGISMGIFYAIPVFLNQVILNYYPTASKDVGIIGLVMLIAGIFGSASSGLILAKFNTLRGCILGASWVYFLSSVVFCVTVEEGITAIYLTCGLLGFLGGAILNFGLELALELTYPLPEDISGGMMVLGFQIFAIIVIYLHSYLYNTVNMLWSNLSISVMLAFAGSILLFVRYDLRRQSVKNCLN